MHWTEAIRRLTQLKLQVPTLTANEMVNFALDNLRAGSWRGVRWPARKPGTVRDAGRALLVDTGEGRRSIRGVAERGGARLEANEYMQAHNEGVNRTVTARSSRGRSFQRNMRLPERRFTGESTEQTARIEKVLAQRIVKALT